MRKTSSFAGRLVGFLAGVASLTILGCEGHQRHHVIAATGTNIGVEVSQNPATQSPQAKLGYQRAEFAIVPTSRGIDDKDKGNGHGPLDVPDVVMELKYAGFFDFSSATGIYQRLAVGRTAVKQPGASVMFVRDAKGEVQQEAAAALKTVVATAGPDDNTRCIETWIDSDEDVNRKKLRAWLKQNKIRAGITLFLEGKELADAREAAVKDATLKISCD